MTTMFGGDSALFYMCVSQLTGAIITLCPILSQTYDNCPIRILNIWRSVSTARRDLVCKFIFTNFFKKKLIKNKYAEIWTITDIWHHSTNDGAFFKPSILLNGRFWLSQSPTCTRVCMCACHIFDTALTKTFANQHTPHRSVLLKAS